jgi:AraC family transcriptional regulator
MSDILAKALADRALTGRPGDAVAHPITSGHGWRVKDVVCTSGPEDSPIEERNDYVSIAVVVAGSFKYRSARGSVVLSPGSLLLGGADESFECSHEHVSGDRCVSFNYEPEFFERLAADSAGKRASLKFPVHRLPELPSLTPLTTEAQLGLHLPRSVNFEELALELAGRVLTTLDGQPVSMKGPTTQDERRIATAVRFIEQNFRQPLSLVELSALIGISHFHFLRTFKQVVGLTPHQFLLRRRLHEAALRLRTSSESVLDIALDAGFGDLSNFNHTFRASFGTTPTNYRALSLSS